MVMEFLLFIEFIRLKLVYLDDSATVSDKQRLEKINSNLIASIAYNELTKEDERIYHELIGHQMTTEEKKLLMLGGGWI